MALRRAGSLSAAAEVLGVTHTTVARRLRGLAEALGVRLFERGPGGYVLTPDGVELSLTAERVEALVIDAERALAGRDHALSGKLRVTTLGVISCGMPEVFSSFVRQYPGVELTLLTDDRRYALQRREADVALRLTREPPPSLVGRRIATIDFAPYASRELWESLGPCRDLSAVPWLHWDERGDAGWLDAWLAEHAPRAKVSMRMDGNFTVMTNAVRDGLGAHFLPCIVADADEALVQIGPAGTETAMPLWLLTLPELRDTRRVRAFLDHCAAHFSARREHEPDGAVSR